MKVVQKKELKKEAGKAKDIEIKSPGIQDKIQTDMLNQMDYDTTKVSRDNTRYRL